MIVLLICLALGAVAFGLHSASRLVQRYGTDHQPSGGLIELRRERRATIHPADFDLLDGLVADAMISDGHWQVRLVPMVEELGTVFDCELPPPPSSRRQRSSWLNESFDALEDAAGLSHPSDETTSRV